MQLRYLRRAGEVTRWDEVNNKFNGCGQKVQHRGENKKYCVECVKQDTSNQDVELYAIEVWKSQMEEYGVTGRMEINNQMD